MGPYAHALAQGTDVSDCRKAGGCREAARLHRPAGRLPAQSQSARERAASSKRLCRMKQDLTTGRYDTRFSGPSLNPLSEDAEYDPQSAAISSAYVSLFNDYVRRDLKYGEGQTYLARSLRVGRQQWDFKHNGNPIGLNVSSDLADAMKTNPRLKVMLNGGYYDLATPFFAAEYEEKHLPIPAFAGQEHRVRLVRVGTHGLRARRMREAAARPCRSLHQERIGRTIASCAISGRVRTALYSSEHESLRAGPSPIRPAPSGSVLHRQLPCLAQCAAARRPPAAGCSRPTPATSRATKSTTRRARRSSSASPSMAGSRIILKCRLSCLGLPGPQPQRSSARRLLRSGRPQQVRDIPPRRMARQSSCTWIRARGSTGTSRRATSIRSRSSSTSTPRQSNYSIALTEVIPPIPTPADTKYIRHIRVQSQVLTKFWGRPMFLSAIVLVPGGFRRPPQRALPAHHLSRPLRERLRRLPHRRLPIRTSSPTTANDFICAGYNRIQQQEAYKFYQQWIAPGFPRVLIVKIQHANPYYDDSYAVNSANVGPYGDAIENELIPAIEKQFRAIGQGWARFRLWRLYRRLGGSGRSGLLSRPLQRRLCGLSRSHRLSRLHEHRPLRRQQRVLPRRRAQTRRPARDARLPRAHLHHHGRHQSLRARSGRSRTQRRAV